MYLPDIIGACALGAVSLGFIFWLMYGKHPWMEKIWAKYPAKEENKEKIFKQ